MPIADMPQSNKQHAVPQNIMDVEFKLVGDLTMRQFAYLFVFGALAYTSFLTVIGIFKWPLVVLFTFLGLGLAFVPIEERGLDEWIANFVRAINSPTQRIWRKAPSIPSAFTYDNLAVVRQEMITLAPTSSRRKLEEYLEYHVIEEKTDPLDIPEKEYAAKVHDAYAHMQSSGVSVAVEEPLVETLPEVSEEQQLPQEFRNLPGKEPTGEPDKAKPEPEGQPEAPKNLSVTSAPISLVPTEVSPQISQPAQKKEETVTSGEAPSRQEKPAPAKPHPQKQKEAHHVVMPQISPGSHAGRRFVNLVPTSGELVLPIRGERTLKTSEQLEIEEDIQDRAEKLKQLLAQVKMETGIRAPERSYKNVETPKMEPGPVQNQQQAGPSHAEEISKRDSEMRKMQVDKERTQTDFESLQRQLLELQNKLKATTPAGDTSASSSSAKPQYASIPPLTSKPNTVSGVVKRSDDAVIEGVLLIIKNAKGEAVRAFKTNSVGQFKLTTPLANGIYTVEVVPGDTKLSFDIISIELRGEVIPPVEIVAKEEGK
jgi:hypothetical protein